MKAYGKYCFEWILAFPLTVAFLLISPQDLGIPSVGFGTCLYAAIACTAFACIRYLKGRDRLIAIGAVAAFLGLPAAYGLLTEGGNYFYSHASFFLVPAIGAACYVAGMFCKVSRVARIFTALIITGTLAVLLVAEIIVPKLCVMLFLSVLLLLFADATQLRWKKSGHTEHSLHITFVAPFVFLWLCICLIFPVGKNPYDWRIFKNLWQQLQELSISISQRVGGSSDDFYTYRAGFSSDPGVHGGESKKDNRLLLRVTPIYGTATYLRLAGQYCDSFENMTWTSTVTENTDDVALDTLETRCAFTTAGTFSDYMQSLEIRVTYQRFKTKHFFAPDKVELDGEDDLENLGVTEAGRNLLYDKKKGIGNEYTVTGYRMNTMHPAFAAFVSEFPGFTEEDWERTLVRSRRAGDFTYSDLLEYRERQKAQYLIPTELGDVAKAFVSDATEEVSTPYERMTAIARALQTFGYTLSPDTFPDTVTDASSFLDYFLTIRRGYCTHFATTMVLLARAEGLPARFVHGFTVQMNGMEALDVNASAAHAWCEIYFEGIGWIPFDATPGYGFADRWSVRGEDPSEYVPTPVLSPSAGQVPPTTADASDDAAAILRGILMALAGLVLLLLFTAVVLFADRVIALRRYKNLSPEARVSVLYRRNLRLLSYLRLPQKAEETLTEYRGRIREELPEGAASWIGDYEAFLYGTAADSEATVRRLTAGNGLLTAEFRAQRPRLYLLCRLGNRLIH